MSQFKSLLHEVVCLDEVSLGILGDYFEDEGRDRLEFDDIIMPFVNLAKMTLDVIETGDDHARSKLKERMQDWFVTSNYYNTHFAKPNFPELPDNLPLLFLGNLMINHVLPTLAEDRHLFNKISKWEFWEDQMFLPTDLVFPISQIQYGSRFEKAYVVFTCARCVTKALQRKAALGEPV